MLEQIPDYLFTEWMAYYSIEPFGSVQNYVQAGIISSTFVNSNPFRGSDSKVATPNDFIPDFTKFLKLEINKEENKTKIIEVMSSLVSTNVLHKERRKKRVQAAKKRKRLLSSLKKGKEVKKK